MALALALPGVGQLSSSTLPDRGCKGAVRKLGLGPQADIRDLDVGDVDDMEVDVPKAFLDYMKDFKLKKSQPKMDFNSKDMCQWVLETAARSSKPIPCPS